MTVEGPFAVPSAQALPIVFGWFTSEPPDPVTSNPDVQPLPMPVQVGALKVGSNTAGNTADDAPACVTLTVQPAMVIVPTRDPPVFGATANVTVSASMPLAPWVMTTNGSWLTAVHAHPVAAVWTFTAAVPPADPTTTMRG